MSKRTKYTAEEKYEILEAYEGGFGTVQQILTMYKTRWDAFYK